MNSEKYCLDEDIIEEKLKSCLNQLIINDFYLLNVNINERTLTHRLAIYLENRFNGWHVDCEYNRDYEKTKKLNFNGNDLKPNIEDLDAKTVYPDIIIHHRGTDDNFIVVEVKKSSNSSEAAREFDNKKLELYKRQLNYQHAFFIDIATNIEEIIEPINEYYNITPFNYI